MGAKMETGQRIENGTTNSTGIRNEMRMSFDAISENEAFARLAVSAFVMPLNPTVEEISDIKTAVSEAVTNAIIHGYDEEYMQEIRGQENCTREGCIQEDNTRESYGEKPGKVHLYCRIEGDRLYIEVKDMGKGIEDVAQAMEPLFTTRPELERSGMGFAFMEAFMDRLEVTSEPGCGTVVLMEKRLRATEEENDL